MITVVLLLAPSTAHYIILCWCGVGDGFMINKNIENCSEAIKKMWNMQRAVINFLISFFFFASGSFVLRKPKCVAWHIVIIIIKISFIISKKKIGNFSLDNGSLHNLKSCKKKVHAKNNNFNSSKKWSHCLPLRPPSVHRLFTFVDLHFLFFFFLPIAAS